MPSSKKANLNYNLDSYGLLTMDKLSKWVKIVGILNIISGSLYCLTIFIFAVPTVVMGIITIVMGTKLTVAANHLEFALQNKDAESFTIAIDQLRQYFLINGILLIITVSLIGLGIILVISFAGFFMDLINQSGFDYSTISSKIFLK
jgi:hypothetical protein